MAFDRSKYNHKYYMKNKGTKHSSAYGTARARCGNPSNKTYANIELRMSKEEWDGLVEGTEVCVLCNGKMTSNGRERTGKTMDRIDPKGHYEVGNVRVVCRSCNSSIKAGGKTMRRKENEKYATQQDLEKMLKQFETTLQAFAERLADIEKKV